MLTHTRTVCCWWEQVSLANANWTGLWVSEPSCFPCAAVNRYILAQQKLSLLEGSSASHCMTMELLSGFKVNWRGMSETCTDENYGQWQLIFFQLTSGLQARICWWTDVYLSEMFLSDVKPPYSFSYHSHSTGFIYMYVSFTLRTQGYK